MGNLKEYKTYILGFVFRVYLESHSNPLLWLFDLFEGQWKTKSYWNQHLKEKVNVGEVSLSKGATRSIDSFLYW